MTVKDNDRPRQLPLPRDLFRDQRLASGDKMAVPTPSILVTPDYADERPSHPQSVLRGDCPAAPAPRRWPSSAADRDPFKAYGERSSSRPYALRLPDAIDLALRQIAAEERIHPLRVIDRVLHEHLKRIGRLPAITQD